LKLSVLFENSFSNLVLLFVTGNLGRVDYITEYEYDLFIRPDTCNPRFRVWFNFTVENGRSDQVSSRFVRYSQHLSTSYRPFLSTSYRPFLRTVITKLSALANRRCIVRPPLRYWRVQVNKHWTESEKHIFTDHCEYKSAKQMVVERRRCTQNVVDTIVKIPYSGFCCYLKHHTHKNPFYPLWRLINTKILPGGARQV